MKLVASGPRPPGRLADLRPSHLAELRMRHTRAGNSALIALRVVLRANPDLPMPFRNALFTPLTNPAPSTTAASYSPAEFRAIQRAARSGVRAMVARIRAGEEELKAWRREQEQGFTDSTPQRGEQSRGSVLNHIALVGDIPRSPSSSPRGKGPAKDAWNLFYALFPALSDMAALVVLFQCLTGENLTTICNLTARYSRADASLDGETPVLITRGSKARRGPNKAEMDLAFTAIPEWIQASEGNGESDDYASAFGLYMIAEKLCRRAREFASSNALLVGHSPHRLDTSVNGTGFRPVPHNCMARWEGWTDSDGNPQLVDSRRLRRTFLELHQRPVAQTTDTLANTYLLRDPGSLAANQEVVQHVLEGEVERIQTETVAAVLTKHDIAQAVADVEGVAKRFGITGEKLQSILEGRLDTVATACVDNEHGLVTEPGQPCTASLLLCLGCPNARSEPRHIPIQALMRQQIERRREELTPDRWKQLYGTATEQLDDLLKQ
ncbi:hypothetical protein [Arthrobacter sp. Soil762]|uniref:hypothetical protein n=1 Tax=Arthrobacter sp. Soil762 TaxID=1736401 RepID=UPI001F18E14F|nr:hypothetical protein [Arthrobacter sp. Soil762]